MNDESLLFPDTGPGFLQALKLATLYSSKVNVFALTKPGTFIGLQELIGEGDAFLRLLISATPLTLQPDSQTGVLDNTGTDTGFAPLLNGAASSAIKDYLQTSIQNASTLQMLEDEGILQSISEDLKTRISDNPQVLAEIVKRISISLDNKKQKGVLLDLVEHNERVPSIDSTFAYLAAVAVEYSHATGQYSKEDYQEILDNQDNLALWSYAFYYLFAALCATNNRWSPVTWHRDSQKTFEECAKLLQSDGPIDNAVSIGRSHVAHKLGRMTFNELLPDVTKLPFETILDIRRKRQPELERFRDGLRQLSATIDPFQDERSLALELDEKVHSVVKPAVAGLTASIEEIQRNAIRKLFEPTPSLGDAAGGVVVPVVFSQVATPQAPIVLGLSAVGVIVSRLYEFLYGARVERKNQLDASPWSLLYILKKEHVK